MELEALLRQVQTTFEAYVKLNKRIPPEMLASVATIDDPGRLADTIVAHLSLKLAGQAVDPGDGLAARRGSRSSSSSCRGRSRSCRWSARSAPA